MGGHRVPGHDSWHLDTLVGTTMYRAFRSRLLTVIIFPQQGLEPLG
jgi:hypothetical protein